jgi:lipopolysaccharide transport system permease protein
MPGAAAVAVRDERPLTVIRAASGPLELDLRSLADSGELLYFLVWRDIKVRYKQTLIGVGWAVLQPLLTMAIFTAVFSGLAGIESDGLPYPLFAFTGLIAWTYFAAALSRGSSSLVSNANLLTKVYFPRLIIPLSAVISPLFDCALALLVLIPVMAWFQIVPGPAVLALPLFLLLCALTAFAVSLWLSALCVRYHDVAVVIPFLLQIWMYASPVIYPVSAVPAEWRALYSLNPMVGVIEGFRWALLRSHSPDLAVVGFSVLGVGMLVLGGLIYFSRMERVFADVV